VLISIPYQERVQGGRIMTPYIIVIITGVSYLINVLASLFLRKIKKNTRNTCLSGNKIAEIILTSNQLTYIKINKSETEGNHYYEPFLKVIVLGPDVYDRKTIYSLAVGCHEACHAIRFQYLRLLTLPATSIAIYILIPLLILAFFIQLPIFHGIVLLFYLLIFLIRLIVEVIDEVHINRIALQMLHNLKLLSQEEMSETQKLYRFFNFTYFASLPLKVFFNR
jgi:uncharacterized protein